MCVRTVLIEDGWGGVGRVGGGGGWEDWTLTRGAQERQAHRMCRRSAGDERDQGEGERAAGSSGE